MTAKLRARLKQLKKDMVDLEIALGLEQSRSGKTWTTEQIKTMERLRKHKERGLELARFYKNRLDAFLDYVEAEFNDAR